MGTPSYPANEVAETEASGMTPFAVAASWKYFALAVAGRTKSAAVSVKVEARNLRMRSTVRGAWETARTRRERGAIREVASDWGKSKTTLRG